MLRQAAAWAVLALAGHANAFTFGPAQGQILIGHPLDLRLRAEGVGLDADGVTCLEAELRYGDSRVPAATVTLTLLPADATGAAVLRVRASLPVNEPLVTLMVSTGCSDRYTRSYQLLVDQDPATLALERGADPEPGQPLANAKRPEASAADPAPIAEELAQPPETPSILPQRALRAQAAPIERSKSPRRVRIRSASVPLVRPLRARPAPSATPRLELELIETPASTASTASGAGSATAAAVGSSQGVAAGPKQAEAAPAATPEPTATPQDARLQQMARELEAMRTEQARMLAVVESVNAQLAQARVSRWQDPLVLGLLGSSAASLLGLLLVWVRLRRQRWA